LYRYIEDFIINDKITIDNKIIDNNLNELRDIMKKNYIHNQKKGNTELIKSYVWQIKFLKNIGKTKITDLVDVKEDNNITKLAIKSKNNININRLKEQFNERIIKNKNMIIKSE